MLEILWFIGVSLCLIFYMWWFGHKLSWGKLTEKYKYSGEIEIHSKAKYKHGIWLLESGRGAESFNSVHIAVEEKRMLIAPGPWFRWALPPLLIELDDVVSVDERVEFFKKRAVLKLKNTSISIDIPFNEEWLKNISIDNKY